MTCRHEVMLCIVTFLLSLTLGCRQIPGTRRISISTKASSSHARANADTSELAKKIEAEGGVAIRDETLPESPIIAVCLSSEGEFKTFLKALEHQAALRSLEWKGTPHAVTDDAMPFIGRLQHLQRLDLAGTRVTSAGLAYLVNLSDLVSLSLSGITICDADAKYLRDLPHLRTLTLDGGGITDKFVVQLAHCRSLEALSIFCCVTIGVDGVAACSRIPRLRELQLVGNVQSDEGLMQLAHAKDLRVLSLGGEGGGQITAKGFAGMRALAQLRVLCLGGVDITDEDLRVLQHMPWLECLALKDSKISDKGIVKLLELRRLQHLSLDGSHIEGRTLGHLQHLPGLRSLSLAEVMLSDQNISQLALIRGLHDLSVDDTKLSEEGVRHLRELMPNTIIMEKEPLDVKSLYFCDLW